jgi:hypothetical protein
MKRLKLGDGGPVGTGGAERRRRRRPATSEDLDEEMTMALSGMKSLCVGDDAHEQGLKVAATGIAGAEGMVLVRGGRDHRSNARANACAKAEEAKADVGIGFGKSGRTLMAECGQRDPG